jgi:Sap, sulfolipid-1-addressing protein
MGKAIGEILPYALGAAISVVPIVAIILMLVTPKAKTNGTAFAAGFVLGLAVICTVAVALAGGSDFSSGSGPTKTVSIIKLLLGLLLLVGAARQWRARPKPGEAPAMPKWLESIDPIHAAAVVRHRRRPIGSEPEESRHVAGRRSLDRTSRTVDRAGGGHRRHLRTTGRRDDHRTTHRLPRDGPTRHRDPRRLAHLAGRKQRHRDVRSAARLCSRPRRPGNQRNIRISSPSGAPSRGLESRTLARCESDARKSRRKSAAGSWMPHCVLTDTRFHKMLTGSACRPRRM